MRTTLPRLLQPARSSASASSSSSTTKPVAISSVPAALLRLPPKHLASSPTTAATKEASPTINRILSSFAMKRFARSRINTSTTNAADGRGLGNAVPVDLDAAFASSSSKEGQPALRDLLPPNLRIEQFVNKRIEYEGVKTGHRELTIALYRTTLDQLKKLRREA